MMKLQHLIILLDDQLKLLQNTITVFLPRLSGNIRSLVSVREAVNSARDLCKTMQIDDLLYELELITTGILKDSVLKMELHAFALRLTPLHDQLSQFMLTITLKDDKSKLNKLLLSVEHDLEEIRGRALNDFHLQNAVSDFLSFASQASKDLANPISSARELDVIRRFSSMCQIIRNILIVLRSNDSYNSSPQIAALKKVLLHDWNKMIFLLKDKFEDIYKQKIQPQGVFLSSKKEGAVGFEIMQ